MCHTFKENYGHVIIETNIFGAYNIIRNFNVKSHVVFYHIANQIDLLLRNNSRVRVFGVIFVAYNKVTQYAAKLAMNVCDRLYTLEHPVGGVVEILDWDVGIGVDNPSFVDVAPC